MKISEVKSYILSENLPDSFGFSQGWVKKRSSFLVEIITEDGISGWGESLCHGLQPPEVAYTFVEKCFKPHLIGRSIYDIDVLWEELYNLTRPFGQGGAAVNALSSIDIALYDCMGKVLGQPISNLLGGRYREKVEAYATGFYWKKDGSYPKDWYEEAERHLEKGFQGFKLKCGFGVDKDIESILGVRDFVGNDIKIMADFNCAYNRSTAKRIIAETAEAKLEFYEELLAPEDIEGYSAIRQSTSSHIAAGENILSKHQMRRWMEADALDIYQPDLCSSGGFTECRKMSVLAQSWNTMMMPHVWGSGIGLAASLQFIATIPSMPLCTNRYEPMLEYDQSEHPFRTELIYNDIQMDNGIVVISDKPGIGVEVNREVIEKYSIKF